MSRQEKEFHTFRGYQILTQEKRLLTPSMEDYLEMIYRYYQREGYIRINQLADLLNVQAPSATRIVQRLAKVGLIDYEKYGIIRITEEGEEVGKFLLERHMLIESFLKKIGINETLLRDTEMMEHNISMEALEQIQLFNEFLNYNPDVLMRLQEFKHNKSQSKL